MKRYHTPLMAIVYNTDKNLWSMQVSNACDDEEQIDIVMEKNTSLPLQNSTGAPPLSFLYHHLLQRALGCMIAMNGAATGNEGRRTTR